MKRKTLIIFLLCWCFSSLVNGQLVNRGQLISLGKEALVFIDGDYINTSGNITNNGVLKLKRNWVNNDAKSLVFTILSDGLIEFSGGLQTIGGTNKTVFPNVSLTGTDAKALTHDIDIVGSLYLNDNELKAEEYELTIKSSSPAAISRISGFISTDKKGVLTRNIEGAGNYLFPLGTSTLRGPQGALYRPLTVDTRTAESNHHLSASLVPENPSHDSYYTSNRRQDIKEIFDRYYYMLSHETSSSEAQVKFFQHTAEEEEFTQLVNWNRNYNIWEKAAPSTREDAPLNFAVQVDRSVLLITKEKFTRSPYSFADQESTDKNLLLNPLTFYNAFSPDGDGKNDTWIIKNIDLYPDNNLTIFNRWGDEVFKASGYNSSKAWDGGSLNSGTYYYILNVAINGQMRTFKGFITMIKKD